MVHERIIEPLRKEHPNYTFGFRSLRKSTPHAQRWCGYVPVNQPQQMQLDPQNRSCAISQAIARNLVSKEECKIKLVVLMGCYSYHFAKLFEPFVENIICIHPEFEILDNICTQFSEFFYLKLDQCEYGPKKCEKNNVWRAFYAAKQQLVKCNDKDREFQTAECVADANPDAVIHLRVIRVEEAVSKELEQYLHSEYPPRNALCAKMVENEVDTADFRKRGTHRAVSQFTKNTACSAPNVLSSDLLSVEQSEIVPMSSTEEEGPENECSLEEEDEFSMEWYPSESAFSCPFAVIQCVSAKQRETLKQMLLKRKEEEKEDPSDFALGWDVVECCCTKDVPHREVDKFILLGDGQINPPLVSLEADGDRKRPRRKSLPSHLRLISDNDPSKSTPNKPTPSPQKIGITDIESNED